MSCKYCKDFSIEHLPVETNSDDWKFIAQISFDYGAKTKELVINCRSGAFGIPINYCPICGKKLNGDIN